MSNLFKNETVNTAGIVSNVMNKGGIFDIFSSDKLNQSLCLFFTFCKVIEIAIKWDCKKNVLLHSPLLKFTQL